MKLLRVIAFVLCCVSAMGARADDRRGNDYQIGDVLAEILVLRPAGLIGTVAGTVLFVVTSPFAALANVAPPHDAIEKSRTVFIVAPANYTFERPFGDYHYDPHGHYGQSPR